MDLEIIVLVTDRQRETNIWYHWYVDFLKEFIYKTEIDPQIRKLMATKRKGGRDKLEILD